MSNHSTPFEHIIGRLLKLPLRGICLLARFIVSRLLLVVNLTQQTSQLAFLLFITTQVADTGLGSDTKGRFEVRFNLVVTHFLSRNIYLFFLLFLAFSRHTKSDL